MNGKKQFSRRVTVRMTEALYQNLNMRGHVCQRSMADIVRDLLSRPLETPYERMKRADKMVWESMRPTVIGAVATFTVGIFLGIVIACALIKTGVL